MNTMNDRQTLASRLNEGRIPVSEALHYAMSLADALRKLHDAGKAHGAVTPASIELTSTGLELIPSLGPLATITPLHRSGASARPTGRCPQRHLLVRCAGVR
ncbi:MAG: hypothetical protein WDO73_09795, partial [Ignavibacteriota bacterium]